MKNFFKVTGFILLYLAVYYIITNNLASFVSVFYILRDIINDPAILTNGVLSSNRQIYNSMLVDSALYIQMASAVISFFIYWFILKIRKKNFFEECSFNSTKPANLFLSVVLGLSLLLPISTLVSLLSIDKLSTDSQDRINTIVNGNNIFITLLAIGLVAPIIEEIIFRGLIFGELKRKIPIPAAIVIQALLFGMYHGNYTQAIYASVLGIVLGYVCYKTGSIVSSILVHISFNTLSILFDKVFSNLIDDKIANLVSLIMLMLSFALVIFTFVVLPEINKHRECN